VSSPPLGTDPDDVPDVVVPLVVWFWLGSSGLVSFDGGGGGGGGEGSFD